MTPQKAGLPISPLISMAFAILIYRCANIGHRGWSASRVLRRTDRRIDRQVRYNDDHGLIGSASAGNVWLSHGSISIYKRCRCTHAHMRGMSVRTPIRTTGRGTMKYKNGLRRSATRRGHTPCNASQRLHESLSWSLLSALPLLPCRSRPMQGRRYPLVSGCRWPSHLRPS